MTFLELCQTVRNELGLSGEGPSSVTNQTGQTRQLVSFVATADMLIQTLYADWKFLWKEWELQTVSGQEVYSQPSDLSMWDMESFYLDWGTNNATKLTVQNNKEDVMYAWEREVSTPAKIIFLPDGNIKLNPIPDDIYTITGSYYSTPVYMTGNTSVSAIPAQFHRIIVARAKMLYAEAEEVFTMLQSYAVEYEQMLDKLESHSLEGQQVHSFGQPVPLTVRSI